MAASEKGEDLKIIFLFFLKILKTLKAAAEKGINYIESSRLLPSRVWRFEGATSSFSVLKRYEFYPVYADILALVVLALQVWFFAPAGGGGRGEPAVLISMAGYIAASYAVFAVAMRHIMGDDISSEPSLYILAVFLLLVNNFVFLISEVYGIQYLFLSSGIVFMAALLMPPALSVVFAVLVQIILLPFYTLVGGSIAVLFPALLMSSAMAALIFVVSPPISSRVAIISYGIKISAVNTAIFAFTRELFGGNFAGVEIYYALVSGLVASAFVLIFLPIVELIFKRLSPVSLVELSDINKPLMKQMMLSAPGTYHHSLITASLAEAAADAIGASGALARVGAYYHDIGKLFKPEYFIENQIYSGNPHDEVTPTMSGMVLMAHVKEGVELARRYRLNPRIIDFIEEHHGTSLIIQFYHKAIIKDINVKEKDFRYDGLRPRTRETAVVMLADSVEAASRTLSALKPSAISDMVKKVVNNKFVDGQLNDSPLTLRDIEIITDTMIRTLCGILHVRYQKQSAEESSDGMVKSFQSGASDKVSEDKESAT